MRLHILTLLATSLSLGCISTASELAEGIKHANAVSASLEQTIGTKSLTQFNVLNGALASVTVTFDGIPQNKSVEEIAARTRSAVLAEFGSLPRSLVVGFSVAP